MRCPPSLGSGGLHERHMLASLGSAVGVKRLLIRGCYALDTSADRRPGSQGSVRLSDWRKVDTGLRQVGAQNSSKAFLAATARQSRRPTKKL
jgi:hypothetical protein